MKYNQIWKFRKVARISNFFPLFFSVISALGKGLKLWKRLSDVVKRLQVDDGDKIKEKVSKPYNYTDKKVYNILFRGINKGLNNLFWSTQM